MPAAAHGLCGGCNGGHRAEARPAARAHSRTPGFPRQRGSPGVGHTQGAGAAGQWDATFERLHSASSGSGEVKAELDRLTRTRERLGACKAEPAAPLTMLDEPGRLDSLVTRVKQLLADGNVRGPESQTRRLNPVSFSFLTPLHTHARTLVALSHILLNHDRGARAG